MPVFIKNLTADWVNALTVARWWTTPGAIADENSTAGRALDDIAVLQDPAADGFCSQPESDDPHRASRRKAGAHAGE